MAKIDFGLSACNSNNCVKFGTYKCVLCKNKFCGNHAVNKVEETGTCQECFEGMIDLPIPIIVEKDTKKVVGVWGKW